MTLEIAAFDLDSALRAARAGADRVELCRDASAGGLTPPAEWIEAAVDQAGVPVVVMVRPRADRWTFSAGEHAAMRRDAVAAVRAGASGVVWGALTPDGRIDGSALRALVASVAPAEVAVHRAFDASRDLAESLDMLLACGARRVLTGGGPGPAADGTDLLASLVRQAGDQLAVMPGGGVRAGNAMEIIRRTGAQEIHSGASRPGTTTVDTAEVRRLRAALNGEP